MWFAMGSSSIVKNIDREKSGMELGHWNKTFVFKFSNSFEIAAKGQAQQLLKQIFLGKP